jgi:polyvinyl alcohol dehydrogenase (cytochrome)
MSFSSVFAPQRSASQRRRSARPKPASTRLTLEVLEDRTVPSGLGVDVVPADPNDWPMYNHDPAGSRDNSAEHTLSPATVGGLQVQWTFPTHGPIAGTPAVVDDRVYAADATGTVYALDRDGHELWETPLYVGPTFSNVKVTASALVTNRTVIIGDLSGQIHGLDVDTGAEKWTITPNPHPYASIWGSATMVGKYVAIGTASVEEFVAPSLGSDYHPSFRGSVVLLDPADGHVIWQTFTISPQESAAGASGAPIWSTPTYDRATNTLYVTTGNNYSEPTTGTEDAFIALDAATGAVKWVNQRTRDDTWTFAFGESSASHPDFDIGDSPQVYKLGGETVVSAGQKSGFFHVLDAATGAEVRPPIHLAPSGTVGGLFADSAYADGVVYANGTDWPGLLSGQPPNRGILSAVAADGSHALWNFDTPSSPNISGVAVANGVVYFQSMLDGTFYALDAATGQLLARVATGGESSGPSISRGQIYLGTGDSAFPFLNPMLPLGAGSIVALGLPAQEVRLDRAEHLGSLYWTIPDISNPAAHQNPNTFVGKVPGSDTFLAVVLGGEKAIAYVCDGAHVWAWLHGEVRDGALFLTDDRGDGIVARLEGDAVTGLVDVDGLGSRTFTADRAVDGQSGLFRGVEEIDGEEGVLSLIRIGDGERGNVRTTSNPKGKTIAFVRDGVTSVTEGSVAT